MSLRKGWGMQEQACGRNSTATESPLPINGWIAGE
jgi:hypothetical protein